MHEITRVKEKLSCEREREKEREREREEVVFDLCNIFYFILFFLRNKRMHFIKEGY